MVVAQGLETSFLQKITGVVNKYTGKVASNAIDAYQSAGRMQTEAGKVVDPDPLHAGVTEQVTPIVANQVINQVGAKNTNADSLMEKYPAGGKMISVADEARIIDKTQVNRTIDEKLSPNLAKVQKETFRSGNWDKLALQKVAEESKLFSKEALTTVKNVITDLLETSIRTAVAWGDKRGALDKLNLVASTGLINPEDVAKYREEFLLRDSLIDAQG